MTRTYIAISALILGIIFIGMIASPREKKETGGTKVTSQAPLDSDIVATPTKSPTVIARGLKIPWEIVFLPDGRMLVTERSGTLKLLEGSKVVASIPVEGVYHTGEGGLLGAALHPDFLSNKYIYLYFTTRAATGAENKVARYKFENNALSGATTILEHLPGGTNHNGGRIAFGPDKNLYITTGDAGDSADAQNRASLAGKILRVNDLGVAATGNQQASVVYSYGHRNPQGLAWDKTGKLWATEHGRSGVQSGLDEVNLIRMGVNYGWPEVEGDESRRDMESPIIHSGTKTTWAPAGIAHANGKLYFGGLRGEALYVTTITSDFKLTPPRAYFKNQYGRIRAVVLAPDGYLYFSTSNTDGRGTPREGDDKIIRIHPDAF